jgi:hypothetical protein
MPHNSNPYNLIRNPQSAIPNRQQCNAVGQYMEGLLDRPALRPYGCGGGVHNVHSVHLPPLPDGSDETNGTAGLQFLLII